MIDLFDLTLKQWEKLQEKGVVNGAGWKGGMNFSKILESALDVYKKSFILQKFLKLDINKIDSQLKTLREISNEHDLCYNLWDLGHKHYLIKAKHWYWSFRNIKNYVDQVFCIKLWLILENDYRLPIRLFVQFMLWYKWNKYYNNKWITYEEFKNTYLIK